MGATREQIAAETREWIGTPYHHQALVKGVGCDCIGVIRGVGNATSALVTEDTSKLVKQFLGYSRQPNPKVMRAALQEFLVPIDKKEAGVGDIFWFRIQRPQHLGILTEPGIVVHADRMAGRVIEHSVRYMRIVAAYRFPGLSNP